LILLGVPQLGGYNYITRVARGCQRQLGFLVISACKFSLWPQPFS